MALMTAMMEVMRLKTVASITDLNVGFLSLLVSLSFCLCVYRITAKVVSRFHRNLVL